MKQQTPLLWLILVVVTLLCGLEAYRIWNEEATRGGGTSKTGEEALRDYAAMLKANQLYSRAAEVYDTYVAQAPLTDAEKARIDFNTGTMLLDQLGDAEGALAHFLRITELYEDVDREILKQARKLSSECLEKLGRSGAAQRQLIASAELGATDASAEKKVLEEETLVKLGNRVVLTRADFDQAWNEIPEYVRKQQYPNPDGKKKFLQELAATKVFSEAARRKGFDRDPEVRRRVQMLEESLLAQKLFQTEVSDKIRIPDSDLDLFYKAHREHYSEPAAVEIAHIFCSSEERIAAASAAIRAGSSFEEVAKNFSEDEKTRNQGGKLGTIRQKPRPLKPTPDYSPLDTYVPGLGREPEIIRAVFASSEVGEVTGPVKSSRGFHLIKILSITPPRQKPFEEVRTQVESELRAQREEERKAELVQELMKAEKVRVYPDHLE